ncbi:MAG: response regulator transcription factor [Candidatus Binatia bacterium]|nr:response regulator transcription factor [Candidatus Binatia bacterium]
MDRKKILIVEDDRDIATGLSLRLKANGYDTAYAGDAHSGIDMASKDKPDLILLDLGLPDDNGFVLMKKMENIPSLSSVPVIVLTGRPQEVYKEATVLAGAKKYLQKPVENQELLAAIREVLRLDAEPVTETFPSSGRHREE